MFRRTPRGTYKVHAVGSFPLIEFERLRALLQFTGASGRHSADSFGQNNEEAPSV